MESNFKKYMAYAAGEIVLVVIGILIALQISNWLLRVYLDLYFLTCINWSLRVYFDLGVGI